VSERDRGQSDAINKGLARCTGDVFNWLNADDLWTPGAALAVAETWQPDSPAIVAGTVVNFWEDGRERAFVPDAIRLENFLRPRDGRVNRLVWHQPGTFLPLAEVRRAGGLREDMRYAMDHLLMVALLQTCPVRYIGSTLARFRVHGGSKTSRDGARFRLEAFEVLRRNGAAPAGYAADLRRAHADALWGCARAAAAAGRPGEAAARFARAASVAPIWLGRCFLSALDRRLRRA
jgi:glycosyltransferase involved in cell wall biosynthesis